MKERKRDLVIIALFTLWIQFLAIEHLPAKAYGHWGLTEFGRVAIAIQGSAELFVVNGLAASRRSGVSGRFSYVSELWECGKAGTIAAIPYLIYWYYFWYL